MMSANATRPNAITATRINASLEDEEWNRIFPIKVAQSYTSSIKFMKQLTTIAFSIITFLKHMFPEENYTHQNFMGIILKILKEKCEDEFAQCATTALINSFDALDKKYLEKLVLCLYEGDGEQHPDMLVETYALSFEYKPAGGEPGPAAEADAREQTLSLLRACISYATESPQQRPAASYGLTIRLYYNESAPAEYQAPGFSSVREEGGVEAALQGARHITCVRTPHHSARLLVYNSPCSTNATHDGDTDASTRTTSIPSFSQQELDDIREVMWEQAPVRCECGLEDVAEPMLTCSCCGKRQHAACYGKRGAAPADAHYCVPCARAGRGPLCASLAPFIDTERTLRGVCMYRRMLWWCSTRTHVSAGTLCDALGVEGALGARLLHVLLGARVIMQPDGIQKIDHEQLKVAIDEHFRPKDDSVVERLVAESQSQGEVDPVQEALRPAERSTLQAAAGAAPLMPRAPPQPLVQDSTLELYRKAVCFTDDTEDDLPLSGKHNPVPTIEQTEKKIAKRKPDSEKPLLKSRLSTKRSKLMMAQKNKKT